MHELDVEILRVGVWNYLNITQEKMESLVKNFNALHEVMDVPLKFGHNKKQPMTDGQPALGWISKVWMENDVMMGHFTDLPEIVFNALKQKRYKNVSIEALQDVVHKEKSYGMVLTAVALLGADMPAVNTLSDLQTYMTSKNIDFSSHATFTKKSFINESIEEYDPMTPDEQAEMDWLKAENKAQAGTIAANAASSVKLTADHATLKTEVDTLKKQGEATAFTAEKKTLTDDLEAMVKSKHIQPAVRDDLLKSITEDSIANVKFTVETLKKSAPTDKNLDEGESASSDNNKDNEVLRASEKVAMKASELTAKNSALTFSAAVSTVLQADKKLAAEYANENDEEAA